MMNDLVIKLCKLYIFNSKMIVSNKWINMLTLSIPNFFMKVDVNLIMVGDFKIDAYDE